jgi:hypothetical protein
MGTPVFSIRLPEETQRDIAVIAKIYGSPNPRAFIREALEVMVSGDFKRIGAFNARLMQGMGEQLTLQMTPAPEAEKPASKPKSPRKRAKPRGRS